MPGLVGRISGWLAGAFGWFDPSEEVAESIFLIDLIQDIQVQQIDLAVISGSAQTVEDDTSPRLADYIARKAGFAWWEPWAVFRD